MNTNIIEVLLNEQERQAAEQRDAEHLSQLKSIRRSMLDSKKSAHISAESDKETSKNVSELVSFFKRWHNTNSSQEAPHDRKTFVAEKLLHKKEYLENLKRLKAIKTAITDSNKALIDELRDQERRGELRVSRKHAPQHISPWSRNLEYRKVDKNAPSRNQNDGSPKRSLLDEILDNMDDDRRGRKRRGRVPRRRGRFGRAWDVLRRGRPRTGSGFFAGAKRIAGSVLDSGKSLLGIGRAAESAKGVSRAARVAGSVAPEAGFLARNAGTVRGLGIAGTVVATAAGAKELYDIRTSKAPEEVKNKATANFAGRTAGGVAGGLVGAKIGGALGMLGGPAAPVTVPLGALLGGSIGAIAGSKYGGDAGDGMFSYFHKPPEKKKKPADSGNTNLLVAKAVATNTKVYKDTTENKLIPAMSDISKTFKDGWQNLKDSAGDVGTWAADKVHQAGEGAKNLLHRGGAAVARATKGTVFEGAGKSVAGGADYLGGKVKAAADYGSQAITGIVDNGGTTKRRVFKKADGTVETRTGGTISWRNNNPGNMRTSYVGGRNDVGAQFKSKDAALAYYRKRYDGLVDLDYNGDFVFATKEAGDEAKRKRVFQMAGNKTFDQMIRGYAKDDRSGKANHSAYANTVFKAVREAGFDPEKYRGMQLNQMPREVQNAVMSGMKKMEGYKEGTVTVEGTPTKPANAKPAPAGAAKTQTAQAKKPAPAPTPAKPTQVAKADVNGKAPVRHHKAAVGEPAATKVAQAPTVRKVQAQSVAPKTVAKPVVAVNEVKATPQALVPPSTPRESVKIYSDERPQSAADADSTPTNTGYNGANGGTGPIPTLDDVPGSISELGLAFLNLGNS